MPFYRSRTEPSDTSPTNTTNDPSAPDNNDEAVTINDVARSGTERDDATIAGVIHDDEFAHQPSGQDVAVEVGIDVVGACGHKIGEVVDIRDDCIVVEKGFFIPKDLYVPKSAVSGADEHNLTLKVTRSTVDRSNWDEDPDEALHRPHEPRRRAS